MTNSDRGNAAFTSNRIPALNAKLHAGHDGNAEHRNQSNLLSSVQYGYGAQGLVAAEILPAAGSPFTQTNNSPLNLSSSTQSFIGDNNNVFALQLNNSVAPLNSGIASLVNNDQVLGLANSNAAILPNANSNLALPREGGLALPPQNPGALPNDTGGTPITHPAVGPVVGPSLLAPILSTGPATGDENQPIAVPIAVVPQTDQNGLTLVIISNVPSGAVLSAGVDEGNGSWSLTLNQLQGLTITPPLNTSGEINLTMTAVSTDNGLSSSSTAVVQVVVTGVPITPTLSTAPASGPEDTAITLNIHAALANVDVNENLSITITGVPQSAVLSAGTHNSDGSWTLTSAQLASLTITPPANYIGTINLGVTATASENNTSASISSALPVTVTGVAETPTLTLQAAIGLEDTSIALNITAGLLGDILHETLTVTITGVPVGATLSAGTHNSDGSWTLTSAQLAGLLITPAENYSGDINLNVTVTASENGTSASVSGTLPVTVSPIAETPILLVQSSVGNENTAIALHITAALANIDPSETLNVTITGVPVGATLSAGTHNTDGSWTLTSAQLSGLTLTPTENYTGTINLNVTATASENGTSANISAPLPVTVNTLVDAPSLTVQAASGTEDTAIALHITAALTDVGSSETLTIIVGGVPVGATLSAGTHNADGTWTLTSAQLSGLTLTPPLHAVGNYTLSVWAVASENGVSANTEADLQVTVNAPNGNPTAAAPILIVAAVSGGEDTAIPLAIVAAAPDLGEQLSVTISGVPTNAILSAGTNNHDGTWTLTAAQLSLLTITPPTGYTGALNLTVTATGTENGASASTSAMLQVNVTGTPAHAPLLVTLPAVGNENTPIALHISSTPTDTLSTTETQSILISGVPTGATLSAGTNNHDGTWTLAASDLNNLTITPPSYYTGTLHLGVTATANDNGTSASVSGGVDVTVNTVVNAPTVTVQAASGNENTPISLSISTALADVGSPEALNVTITGVPVGATLSAGTHNSDGSWTLSTAQLSGLTLTPPLHFTGSIGLAVTATASESGTNASVSANLPVTVNDIPHAPLLSVGVDAGLENSAIALNIAAGLTDNSEALSVVISGVPAGAVLSAGMNNGNGTWSLAAADLVGLTITPPQDYSGTMALTVAAISTDALGIAATTTLGLNVAVAAVADTPILLAVPAIGSEDSPIALSINSALTNILGSETLAIHITGVPAGAILSAGIHNSDGSWTLTSAQLSGLTITPPLHSNADFTLTVTAIATDTSDNATATQTVSLPVTVIGIAHVPTVNVHDVSGAAGADVNLSISGALSVNAGSTESLSYVIHGVPDGFALNHGSNNGDNTWTLSASDLANLQLISPPGFNGQLTLYATSVAHDSEGSVAVSSPGLFHVALGSGGLAVNLGLDANVGGIGVGVGVDLFPNAGGLTSASMQVKENTPYVISDASLLTGLSILNGVTNLIANITVSDVPTGASFNHGTNLGSGIWQFSVTDLTNLTFTPPANTDGTYTLTTTAHMLLGLANVALGSTTLNIMGIAATPNLTASAGTATEEHPIALNITGALGNADGSEVLSYLVSGLPSGFTLNHGVNNGNGDWSLTASDLSGLQINPAAGFSGTANVTVSAIATETDGDQAVLQQTLNLNVAAIAHAPTIAAVSISGSEDQSTPLNLGITAHASEHISALTISGVPVGATLSYATDKNGVWTVDPAHIADVQLVPPTHWSGDANLTITATSQAGTSGPTVTTTETLPLHIAAVATAPTLAVSDSTGNENAPIALSINAAGLDTGGAENISVMLSGVPNGGQFSAGVNNGNGTWTVAESALHDLTFTAPHNFSGDVTITATALATEVSNGSTASTHMDMHIHVLPVG